MEDDYVLVEIPNDTSKPNFSNSKLYKKLDLYKYYISQLIKVYQLFTIYRNYKKSYQIISILNLLYLLIV